MDEEDEHSPSEFYYPEDLETFDVETECHIINNLLTERENRTEEYWPSVRTATTSGQYSPVRPSRSVSKRLLSLTGCIYQLTIVQHSQVMQTVPVQP